jgi:hypothetical protein
VSICRLLSMGWCGVVLRGILTVMASQTLISVWLKASRDSTAQTSVPTTPVRSRSTVRYFRYFRYLPSPRAGVPAAQ